MIFPIFTGKLKYAELEIDEVYNECYPDYTLFNEKSCYDTGLGESVYGYDFEKDEKDKLLQIEYLEISN